MDKFLDQIWLDNPVKSYVAVAFVILLIIMFKRFISRYFAVLIYSLAKRNWKNIDKKMFVDLVVHPLGVFFVIFVSIVALHKLKFPTQLDVDIYNVTTKEVFHSLGSMAIIISFFWLLLRIIDFIAAVLEQKANLTPNLSDNQLIIFFKDFLKVILIIFCILMVLHFAFNFRIGNFLTGLSIVGAAIALALRESIENLIASFIIFFDKPFIAGDSVKVQNVSGSVEKIGLRSTRIRTDQKTYVTVPNKQMVDSILDNISQRSQHRGQLTLNLSLSATSEKIDELIERIKTILSRPDLLSNTVLLSDISQQAYIVTVEYFTDDIPQADFNLIKQDVNMKVLRLMEELEIEIAGAGTRIEITGQERSS